MFFQQESSQKLLGNRWLLIYGTHCRRRSVVHENEDIKANIKGDTDEHNTRNMGGAGAKTKGINMKRTIGIALLVGGLFVPRLAPGQGTLYYSNLGEITAGGMAVGSDNWLAHGFKTGTNSGGYSLNGIQLLMGASTGNPGGFSVALYSHSPGGVTPPGSFLGSLSGPDPAAGGTFTYNSDGLLLDPATWYFVVVTGSTPIGTGAYSWSGTDSYNAAVSDGWLRAGFDQYSRTGLVWGRIVGPLFQLGISATAVPEPATLSLVGLGLVVLGFWRCKRK